MPILPISTTSLTPIPCRALQLFSCCILELVLGKSDFDSCIWRNLRNDSINLNFGYQDSWISKYTWISEDQNIEYVEEDSWICLERFTIHGFIHLPSFIELELLILLLLGVHTGFRDFLESPCSRIFFFATERWSMRGLNPRKVCCLVGSRKFTVLKPSLKIHECLNIYKF